MLFHSEDRMTEQDWELILESVCTHSDYDLERVGPTSQDNNYLWGTLKHRVTGEIVHVKVLQILTPEEAIIEVFAQIESGDDDI